MELAEVADRVWVARLPWFDVNVAVVGGERGLVVVDTHASTTSGVAVAEAARGLGAGEVVAVVATHWHLDHVLGTSGLRSVWPDVPVHAHETCAEELRERMPSAVDHHARLEPDRAAELRASEVVAPDRPFSAAAALDLGDRLVELLHPGRGHTGGDAVVRVADADVVLAGDLVEEAVPAGSEQAVPGFGDDCFPLAWPASLDVLLDLLTPCTVVVPGHGAPVGRPFVEDQRDEVGRVAQGVLDAAAAGLGPDAALAEGVWPYPRALLGDAVRRGYAQLPRGARRLPLA